MPSVCRVDGFGGKRLPLRTDRHAIRTSGQIADGSITRGGCVTLSQRPAQLHDACPIARSRYLDHLRVERRLADHTLESYARDLRALARVRRRRRSADSRRSTARRSKRSSAQLMTRGLSPRSVARTVAAVRGFYRFLVLDGRLDAEPGRRLRPPRAWPALPKFLSLDEVDALIAQPDVVDAARPARPRDDRGALRHRHARLRAGRRPRRRSASRRAVSDLHRQGQQGADRADRRAGRRVGRSAISATARPALLARAGATPAAVRQRARRAARAGSASGRS